MASRCQRTNTNLIFPLQTPTDDFCVYRFQNSEFVQPPLLRYWVKICTMCAVIELIGRQFIILITPLPVEQSQEGVLNFSGWISVRTQLSSPTLISTGCLCCPFDTSGAITALSLLYSASFPCSTALLFSRSSSDPVCSEVNDLSASPELLVRERQPASGCNSSTIRSAAPVQLPPSLCLLPHTRLLRHTLTRASRQAPGPQTRLKSHFY